MENDLVYIFIHCSSRKAELLHLKLLTKYFSGEHIF